MAHLFVHHAKALCMLAESLGLDPTKRHITAITVKASIKEMTKVTIEEIIDLGQHEGLCTVLKEYRLMPIEPEKQEPASSEIKFREFI